MTPAPRLPDDDARFALGVAGLALTGLAVRDRSVGAMEAEVFGAVNRLPGAIYRPGWVVMQGGNVAAVPVAGALAWCAGRPRLAARLVIAGFSTWTLAKLIKRLYRRPRPAGLVADVVFRGPAATGQGYVSGHTGVAVGIGVAVLPEFGRAGRVATALAVPAVGLCRMYVGAHLPLDVLGGAALGLAVDAAVNRALGAPTPPPAASSRWRCRRPASCRGSRRPSAPAASPAPRTAP